MIQRSAIPPREELLELLTYDPETGVIMWRPGLWRGQWRRKLSRPAGSVGANGYRKIKFKRKLYGAHRLAFMIMTGRQPGPDIDHIDGNRDNNRWANLREVSRLENTWNRSITECSSRSKSRYLGVSAERSRWRARITVNRQIIQLGIFDAEADAHAAYVAAKRLYHASSAEAAIARARK